MGKISTPLRDAGREIFFSVFSRQRDVGCYAKAEYIGTQKLNFNWRNLKWTKK